MYLIKLLKAEFSDVLKVEEIGSTINSNPIYKISFKLNPLSTTGILFTGIHHAREPVSLLMNFYILFKILYELQLGNSDYFELIYTRNIYFVPLINMDGYQYNVNLFEESNGKTFGLARKNRITGSLFTKCDEYFFFFSLVIFKII